MSQKPTRSPTGKDRAAGDSAAGSGPGPEQADGDLSYEAAREELLEVVRRLEQGGTTLEESLALWERGERLAQICQAWLDGARARLDAVVEGRDRGSASG